MTQGSQSLTLGLTLTAAPQLVCACDFGLATVAQKAPTFPSLPAIFFV